MGAVLEIELLRTFHAVARLQQFKAAAIHLNKSPAAISVHIQRLETIAGARLLERDNQGVALTAVGSRLLTTSQALLAAHDRALSELQGSTATGRVRLGVPDEYVVHVITDILPLFCAVWPNIVLEVTTAPSDLLRDEVSRGKLDLAVIAQVAGQHLDQRSTVLQATTPLWVSGARIVHPANEPLPLALYASPCPYREAMTRTLNDAGIAWRIALDTPSGAAVKASVEAGLGVSVMDPWRVTAQMKVLEHLPTLPKHEIVIVEGEHDHGSAPQAIALLTGAIRERFRL